MSSFTPTTTPGSQPPTEERNLHAQRRLFTSRQPLSPSPTIEEVSITINALLQDVHAITATVAELSTTVASLGLVFRRSSAQSDEIHENYVTKEELNDINQLNETIINDLIKVRDECVNATLLLARTVASRTTSSSTPSSVVITSDKMFDTTKELGTIPEVTPLEHRDGQPLPPTKIKHIMDDNTSAYNTRSTAPDVTPLLKQLKTAYYALTDIHERQQQRELQLNFLTAGGDIVFKRFCAALTRVLTATRPGHAPALLNLQRRLKDEAYDGISNGLLAQLLLAATCNNTQIVLSQIVRDSPQAQVDGRLLLLHVHCRLITYPPSLDNSFLTKAKALRISESEDPAVKLNTFTTLIGNHRQLHPAFSGQQEQEVIRAYDEDNRLTASGYPGGLQKFIEAIGKSKPKEKHPGGRGGKGGKGGKDTHPRATTPPPSRPRSPLRGGTRADFFEHEKALYKAAKLKHAGSTNKDSTPSGTPGMA
ncbi:hypothetical protein CYMTET_54560 [Cymbomonas tetramitiformis]|uniref:Uncharacterized protein n=1 Tax=Cymbomonas tetramitiformis TaxID=36881 RepID=A0AAE0BGG7_9CHLO|nr:hypothetical protein CYMTET_54560 [Cymbomonas tetramitiformis]